MRVSRIVFVHGSAENRPVVQAAAERVFPDAEIVETDTLDEALCLDPSLAAELLVLAEPDEETASAAVQAVDRAGRPRWAVVMLGGAGGDLAECVPAEDWNVPLLSRVFRAVVLQHQLLQENLRLKGDLLTVAHRVRHDLQTPIGCVFTSAHVLDLLSPEDRTAFATMVENIKFSSQEISQLVERICVALRATADAPVPVPIDMHSVVLPVQKQMAAEAERIGATVSVASAWPEVEGVGLWLHVIWTNLFDNALKHGGPKPEIRLGWEVVSDGYRFFVSDSGPGIAPAQQPGLFRPFEELHTLRTPGLGLAIVHRLVTLLGGHCDHERTANGSTVFSFTLPASKAAGA